MPSVRGFKRLPKLHCFTKRINDLFIYLSWPPDAMDGTRPCYSNLCYITASTDTSLAVAHDLADWLNILGLPNVSRTNV